MKGILKWPLVIAVVVIVARVVYERRGAPPQVTNWFSSVALILLLPLYFAVRIAISGVSQPYLEQFKTTAFYAIIVRAMVLVVYWAAFIFKWEEPRFGGVSNNPSAFMGIVVVPGATALFWIIASLIVGGGLGSLIIALLRPRRQIS